MRIQSLLASTLLTAALALGACKKADDHSHAPAPAPTAAPTAAAKPHGDHNPHHGGVVMMTADAHVEAVLGTDGKHRIYWTDNARDALPASTYEKVSLSIVRPGEPPEEIAFAKDGKNEAWEGQGRPLAEPAKADLTIHYNKPGQPPAPPQKIVFPVASAGGHGHGHAAEGAHEHAAPHGGLVASTTGGHVELVASADGAFKLWLLDEQLANRPVAGVTASVKVAAAGYADVPLAVVGDHLEGKGAAIAAGQAPAVVTVKLGDKAETARFTLQLKE